MNQNLKDQINYSCMEFNGDLLNPSFSTYLFEILKKGETYFYIGMTGDPHYPSARSILHRLGGHIDLSKRSTQSQFIIRIKELFGKGKSQHLTLDELQTLKIRLHHWAIPGFKRWAGNMQELDKTTENYIYYDTQRKRVSNLENKMINDFAGKHSLNKTTAKSNSDLNKYEQMIYNAVKDIIEAK